MRALGRVAAPLSIALGLAGCLSWTPHHRTLAAPPRPPPPPPPALSAERAAPLEKVVKVRVPTPLKCVPEDLGPAPAYPDTDQALRAAGGAADRYQLLAAGRLLRDDRLAKLEEVVKKCRQAGRSPPPG
jgi:hypothetical protein